jgi:hypothetical protein
VPERAVQVTLKAHDGTAESVPGRLQEFTHVDRLRRAILTMLGAILVAAMLIPIPIVHLVGIPLMLVLGIFASIRQFASTVRLRPARVACPKCQGVNRVGGGWGYRSVGQPIERQCEQCRRGLTLTITPTG